MHLGVCACTCVREESKCSILMMHSGRSHNTTIIFLFFFNYGDSNTVCAVYTCIHVNVKPHINVFHTYNSLVLKREPGTLYNVRNVSCTVLNLEPRTTKEKKLPGC